MSDPQSESKDDVQFTFEPIAPPPPAKKGLLSKFGPIGLLLFFVFGKFSRLFQLDGEYSRLEYISNA